MGNLNQINRRGFLQLTGCGISGLFLSAMGFSGATNAIQKIKLGPASPDRPNILLMVMDTVRSESLSVYGYQRSTTPQMERLARGGVLFTRAIATSPWTLPSHASMFTGHYPFELSTGFFKPLDRTFPTLAEELGKNGYETAGFVANKVYCNWEFGLDRGFNHYEDFRITPETFLLNSALIDGISNEIGFEKEHRTHNNFGRKSADQVRLDFIDWLEKRHANQPFFAFLNFFDAHIPYLAPEKYTSRFTDKKPISDYPPNLYKTKDPAAISELNIAYDAGIAYIDEQMGLIVDKLDSKGILKNTIVFIVSDHGEHFGEHGQFGHGNSLYMTLIHVPLLVLGSSRVPQGVIVNAPVSLIDIPETIVSLTNLDVKFPGKSLARFWGDNPPSELIRSQVVLDSYDVAGVAPLGNWESFIHNDLHYIKQPDGKEELYNLSRDSLEHNNLIKSINYKGKLDYFRQQLTKV